MLSSLARCPVNLVTFFSGYLCRSLGGESAWLGCLSFLLSSRDTFVDRLLVCERSELGVGYLPADSAGALVNRLVRYAVYLGMGCLPAGLAGAV